MEHAEEDGLRRDRKGDARAGGYAERGERVAEAALEEEKGQRAEERRREELACRRVTRAARVGRTEKS